jgi:hypothetical protein
MSLRRFVLVCSLLLTSPVWGSACARTLTPAEVEALGHHNYPKHAPAQVLDASVVALRTMGFEVVVAEGGTVKTAPKPIMVTASGGGGVAYAASNDMAWDLTFESAGDGTKVHAVPRMISAGTSYDGPVQADYIEKAMADLFKEIQSNLR